MSAATDLIERRIELRQAQRKASDELSSIWRRLSELDGGPAKEAEQFKAKDKLRHTEKRVLDIDLELIRVEGELEKLEWSE